MAPLPCAGSTTYSPLRHWKVGRGHKVGVIGLGGLGHTGIQFAKAFGAHVVMIQVNEAYERMLKNDVKYRFVIDMASIGQR